MSSEEYTKAFDKGLTILIGGHGSGKSEFAIMWARRLIASERKPVILVDLDTIKPLFRSQEASKALEKEGIRVMISSVPHSDMPAVSAAMFGMINDRTNWMVVDVGGDAIGARILASIHKNIHGRDYNLLYILNASRPFNSDAESGTREMKRIEAVSGLKITGLISNTHMLDETDPDIVIHGIRISREISKMVNIPLIGVMVKPEIAAEIDLPDDLEVFIIHRMLNPYWMRDY